MSMHTSAATLPRPRTQARTCTSWWLPREAALNWLALGLLLGAWNAADDGAARRPGTVRGYDTVSLRALQRSSD